MAHLPALGPIMRRSSMRLNAKPRMTTVWHASKRLHNQLGQTLDGRIRQPLQAGHDLAVSEILKVLSLDPERASDAAGWVGEEYLGQFIRGKVPDAIIVRSDDIPVAIDYVGHYPYDRVNLAVQFYSRLGLPFELW